MYGGEKIAAVLQAHGVTELFTLCGGQISPILTGAKALGVRIVDVRDEATAVFAADAVARLSGESGVAAVTAGPGLANTITAIKNAQLGQSPIVILGGAAPTVLQHTDYHLAAEGLGAKGFLLDNPKKIESVVNKAKKAVAGGQPVLINALLGRSSYREGSIST